MKINLSLVLPAYNVEDTLSDHVDNIVDVLKTMVSRYELIIVNDGSIDQTYEVIKKLKIKYPKTIKLISYSRNMGKGYALRLGLKKCVGQYAGFIDADGDIDPRSIRNLYKIILKGGCDIVVGSKNSLQSKVDTPNYRKRVSRFSQILIKLLFNLNLTDTQAGLKIFRSQVLKSVLPNLSITGFAIDVEFLTIAKKLGFEKMCEAPIIVSLQSSNRMNIVEMLRFIKDIKNTFIEFIHIFIRLKFGLLKTRQ